MEKTEKGFSERRRHTGVFLSTGSADLGGEYRSISSHLIIYNIHMLQFFSYQFNIKIKTKRNDNV